MESINFLHENKDAFIRDWHMLLTIFWYPRRHWKFPQNDERHQLHISARNLSSDHIYRDVQHFVTYRSSKWQDQFASHGFHNWEIIDRFKTNWIIEKITINEKTLQWKNCRSSVSEIWYHEMSKILFKDELEVCEFKQKQYYRLHIRIFSFTFRRVAQIDWAMKRRTGHLWLQDHAQMIRIFPVSGVVYFHSTCARPTE